MSDHQYTPETKTSWPSEAPRLSPTRAFVVQFREEPEGTQNHFAGRVEHMTSGRAARFHSPEELLAFFTQALTALRTKSL